MSKQKNKLVKNTIISIVSGSLLIFITIQLYPLIFKSSYEEYEKNIVTVRDFLTKYTNFYI